ncbi:MAG: 50S ribosomal protein L33 [Mycoplasmataceae bacterium]|nr:50S ribosomal protein L33 [Mycoplasmataceae bacterium]
MSKNKVTLACSECKHKNYRVAKSGDKRLAIKKFCKNCSSHLLHKEEK